MSIKKLYKKQTDILNRISQKVDKRTFNSILKAIEYEYKIANKK